MRKYSAKRWYNKGVEGLYKQGEEEIAKYEVWSYKYAKNILRGRFELGEESITKHPFILWCYIRDVIGKRFRKGEKFLKGTMWYGEYIRFLRTKGIIISNRKRIKT